jgi:hypothetical protein
MAALVFTSKDLLHGQSSRRTWDAMRPEQQQNLLEWINAPRRSRPRQARAKDAQFALASFGSQVDPPPSIQNITDIVLALNLIS